MTTTLTGSQGRSLLRSISALLRDQPFFCPAKGQGEVGHLQLGRGSSSQPDHSGPDLRLPALELGEILSCC